MIKKDNRIIIQAVFIAGFLAFARCSSMIDDFSSDEKHVDEFSGVENHIPDWSEKEVAGTHPALWTSVASSSDGTRLAAAVYGGYIYTSTDGGTI